MGENKPLDCAAERGISLRYVEKIDTLMHAQSIPTHTPGDRSLT